MRTAILASGQSLTDADCLIVRDARDSGLIDSVIAVSNVGIDKAPWADAIVSADINWWRAHPEAQLYDGPKYSRDGDENLGLRKCDWRGIKTINSGLLAMFVAVDDFAASEIVLLGFDMHGTHYFGPHKRGINPLTNTSPQGFYTHVQQFRLFSGASVYNATKESALTRFPMVDLAEHLDEVRRLSNGRKADRDVLRQHAEGNSAQDLS